MQSNAGLGSIIIAIPIPHWRFPASVVQVPFQLLGEKRIICPFLTKDKFDQLGVVAVVIDAGTSKLARGSLDDEGVVAKSSYS